jgi:hypothetical protein
MKYLTAEQARLEHARVNEERERNRRLYPEEAAFVDEVRNLFGSGAKVVYFGEPRETSVEHYSDAKPLPDGK